MKITRISTLTGIIHTRDLPVTQGELERHMGGELAQNVWGHLDKYDREFLISGNTKEEWEEAFGKLEPHPLMETQKFNTLKPNELYSTAREDGMVIGVTDDISQLAQIIADEHCGADVIIHKIGYNKHDCSYDVTALVTEEGSLEGDEHGFTVNVTTLYRKPKLVVDQLSFADVYMPSAPVEVLEELQGYETFRDVVDGLGEHIYSIEVGDFHELSDDTRQFIDRIRDEAPEVAYFRFIKY